MDKKRKRVSARMVAEMAGVSLTTVSHVLNNKQPYVNQFSEETKKRIIECAHKLNYRPNIMAAGLKSGKSRLFAVVLRDIWSNPLLRWACSGYDGQMISGINAAAAELGLFPVVGLHQEENPLHQVEVAETLIQAGVDGLIVKSPSPEMDARLERLTEEGVPFVVVFPQRPPQTKIDYVDVDNVKCGCLAAECLVREGCKRILVATAGSESHMESDRIHGCIKIFKDHGLAILEPEPIMTSEGNLVRGQHARLHDRIKRDQVDGIVVTNSGAAVCLIREKNDIGIRIPEDVKVVAHDCGFAESEGSRIMTSVEASWFKVGRLATNRLAELVDNPGSEPSPILVPPVIFRGISCQSVVEEYLTKPDER